MKLAEKHKGVAALILLAWVFATMGIFARFLNTEFALFEQTYLRIGAAFLLGALFFYRDVSWKKFRTLPARQWLILVFRSITLYLGVVFFTDALIHTKYANASFLTTLPLLPVFGYFLLGESLKWKTVAAIGLGFLGVLFVAIANVADFSFGYGELMALLSMLAFDFSYIARKWQSNALNNKETTVIMFAIGSVFLLATSAFLGESLPQASQFSIFIIGALLFSAVFNLLNLYLTNYGFQHVKAGVAGNILTLESVFALAYSLFLYQEVPLLRELLGGALILVSVYLVNRFESTQRSN